MNRKYYFIIIIIVMIFCICLYMMQRDMLFLQTDAVVEINAPFHYEDYIKVVKKGTKADVSCDIKQLDTSLPGQYEVVFDYRRKEYPLTVKVVDTVKPEIKIESPLMVLLDSQPDFMEGLNIEDNSRQKVLLTIDATNLNVHKEGQYHIVYIAQDGSGNQTMVERTVKVVKEYGSAVQSQEKIVYLTFDDGPSQNTKAILDILQQHHIPATFFVTGNHQRYNDYIKEAYQQGHTIGLHSFCHEYEKIYSSTDAYFDDLEKLSQMVKELIGFVPHYIRFPGGSSNKISSQYQKGIMSVLTKEVLLKGYQYYDWNCSLGDAEGTNVAVETLVENATDTKNRNVVILAHDTDDKDTTVAALPQIIEYYQANGYRFAAIDDDSYYAHQSLYN